MQDRIPDIDVIAAFREALESRWRQRRGELRGGFGGQGRFGYIPSPPATITVDVDRLDVVALDVVSAAQSANDGRRGSDRYIVFSRAASKTRPTVMGLDGMNAETPEQWERQRYQRCA